MKIQAIRWVSLVSLVCLSLGASASGLTYHVTDPGLLPNTYYSHGAAVNNSGVAVGVSSDFVDMPYRGF